MAQASDKQPTFEASLKRLEAIVQAIEQGEIGLEESIGRFEEGMNLIKHCRTIISDAEQKIQQLQLASDGTLTPEPFEADVTGDAEPDAS